MTEKHGRIKTRTATRRPTHQRAGGAVSRVEDDDEAAEAGEGSGGSYSSGNSLSRGTEKLFRLQGFQAAVLSVAF